MQTGIVTGASRGLGLALGRALIERGWRIVVDGRGADALEAEWADVPAVTAIQGDVRDPAHRRALVEAAGDEIDLLVNNASLLGPSPQPPLSRYPLHELRRGFEGDVTPPLGVAPLAPPRLAEGARLPHTTPHARGAA